MTRKGSTVETDLFSATRLTNSTNGNPRYELHTSAGDYRTQADAACSYDVANILRTIPHGETIPVVLHTTPAGRVWNIERPTATFRSSATHDRAGHPDRSGQTVTILRPVAAVDPEVGAMFVVQFSDGTQADVFADELTPTD